MKKDNKKHEMLKLAKLVANSEFSTEEFREQRIKQILRDNPDFEASEFKKMIKDAQQKLSEKE